METPSPIRRRLHVFDDRLAYKSVVVGNMFECGNSEERGAGAAVPSRRLLLRRDVVDKGKPDGFALSDSCDEGMEGKDDVSGIGAPSDELKSQGHSARSSSGPVELPVEEAVFHLTSGRLPTCCVCSRSLHSFTCTHCERFVCSQCARDCESCELLFCYFCSTVK